MRFCQNNYVIISIPLWCEGYCIKINGFISVLCFGRISSRGVMEEQKEHVENGHLEKIMWNFQGFSMVFDLQIFRAVARHSFAELPGMKMK